MKDRRANPSRPEAEADGIIEGRNAVTEALRAVIAFGFDTLRLNRIEAQHDTENPASGKVMAHVGMQYEGVMRQRILNKGKFVDVACYAILRSDPRK